MVAGLIDSIAAEGRLVLADALTYTQRTFKPKFVIDLATLTGAIIMALGPEHAGLFSNDDATVEQFTNTLPVSGEKFWRMPCTDDYREQIKSQIADIMNTGGSRYGGATTAAMFLKEFVGETPWIHLDIAGTAWIDDQKKEHPEGGETPHGELVPGDVLPAETVYLSQLGVSRTTLREAIKVLSAKGLVLAKPKTGTVVRAREHWNLLDPAVLNAISGLDLVAATVVDAGRSGLEVILMIIATTR